MLGWKYPVRLHYYEKVGLISSRRKEDYAYRVYDETAVRRLQQTIILRKLRIPIKLIGVILNDYEQIKALQIMREKIIALDDEINALLSGMDLGASQNDADSSSQDSGMVDGLSDIEKFFAQLYAHTDVEAEPSSAGRSMNGHFGTRFLNEDGSFRDLAREKHSSSDIFHSK